MKIDLSGKSALVTGSTGGIGFAIAKGLQDAGAQVVINGRTPDNVADALARLGGPAGAGLSTFRRLRARGIWWRSNRRSISS